VVKNDVHVNVLENVYFAVSDDRVTEYVIVVSLKVNDAIGLVVKVSFGKGLKKRQIVVSKF